MGKLTGKVAVVTGASKGIGARIAQELAAQGASVVVNYASSKEGADKVVADITKAGGKAIAVGGSVAKSEEIDKLFAETRKAFGKLDILVNNAGVYAFAPLEQITEEDITRMYATNVKGLLLVTKAGVALFPQEGGTRYQYRLGCQRADAAHVGGVQRHQECGRCDYACAGEGARPKEDSCELGEPRPRRN